MFGTRKSVVFIAPTSPDYVVHVIADVASDFILCKQAKVK